MRHLALLLPLVFACETDETIDDIADAPGAWCEYTETAIDATEAAALGFSADLGAAIAGERTATLKWDHTGETTALTATFALSDDGYTHRAGEVVVDPDADPGAGDELDCPDTVLGTATMTFTTADGRLDETLEVPVADLGDGVARIDVAFELSDLAGTGPALDIDPADWDTVDIEWAVNLSESAFGGELAVYANRTNDTEDVGHANDIARWPAP